MKVLSKVLFLMLLAGLAYAVGTDSWVDGDEYLHIPKAAVAPTMDGVLDAVWFSAPVIRCDTYTAEDPDAPEGTMPTDWFDLTTEARAMWDGDFFYLFFRSLDDEVDATGTDSYTNDSYEIYFDGDNSKTEGTSFDADDKQWRWVYMEATGNPDSGTSQFAWADTDYGYDFELKIPVADLPMPLEAGHEFGFEIQQNDRDGGARAHLSRWWHTSNFSWNTPSLFGNAILDEHVADEYLPCYKTNTPFEIDADQEDAWLAFPEITQNTWVTDDATLWFLETAVDDFWYDCYMSFRIAWDADYFYAFVEQKDDVNDNTLSDTYQRDSVELYWDGDNSKNESGGYDADDHQLRFVSDGVTADNAGESVWSVVVKDDGFDVEVAVPWSVLAFEPALDELFGFEVQTNDTDDGVARSAMGRWWSYSNSSWNNPSYFGTAYFTQFDAVKNDVAQAESFDLSQNYPNPFNPSTTIKYAVRARENVRLTVYDMLGHQVATLVNEVKNIGTYEATFDASNLSSGNYFYKLEAGDKVITKKMPFLK